MYSESICYLGPTTGPPASMPAPNQAPGSHMMSGPPASMPAPNQAPGSHMMSGPPATSMMMMGPPGGQQLRAPTMTGAPSMGPPGGQQFRPGGHMTGPPPQMAGAPPLGTLYRHFCSVKLFDLVFLYRGPPYGTPHDDGTLWWTISSSRPGWLPSTTRTPWRAPHGSCTPRTTQGQNRPGPNAKPCE